MSTDTRSLIDGGFMSAVIRMVRSYTNTAQLSFRFATIPRLQFPRVPSQNRFSGDLQAVCATAPLHVAIHAAGGTQRS